MTGKFAVSTGVAALFALLLAAPAQAQNTKSWVKSNGSDGNPCTLAAPCSTLQRAHDQTNAGGEVGVIDSGTYGAQLLINRSISIVAEGVDATLLHPGELAVSVSVGANDVVSLRGLIIDGLGTGGVGIYWTTGGTALEIKNCVVRNFKSAAFGFGIWFDKSGGGGKLMVTDTVVANNGTGTTGAGIRIRPLSGGSAQVLLERVTAVNNVFGIAADGAESTAGINMTVVDSTAHGNSQDGIIAVTTAGQAPIGLMVERSRSVNNAFGIRSLGPNVTVRVDGSTVIGNGTGLSFGSGGALLSFGTNKVEANATNGAFSGPVTLK